MFKNQLQELAQRSCFNLPAYACIREGPDHAPRFKASVNFNGEIFESPTYCPTLRQAEHAAAEVALNVLSSRGPSRSLTARVLDETGIYKNLLQETAHRAGLNLPVYTTVRSGPGHVPIFTCTVELAGMNFTGEPAKTKKQAEKNAAIAAWSALKRMPNLDSLTNREADCKEEQDQAVVARVLSSFRSRDECRQARRRDHNQARRRMVRGNSSASSSSSSSTSNDSSVKYPHWRLLDLMLDSALDGSTKKQNSFVSLLPPPPPRTTSMILPPISARENPSPYPPNRPILARQVRPKTPGKKQDQVAIPLEEHEKDEEEWLGTKKSIEKEGSSSVFYRPFHFSNAGNHGSSLLDKTTTTAHLQSSAHISSRSFGPSPIYTGGFKPQRLAPAVQIRSVIPVCAAPPSAIRPPQAHQPSASSAAIASSPSTTTPLNSTQAGAAAAELSMPTTSNNKTEDTNSSPVISSSEFNRKLQL